MTDVLTRVRRWWSGLTGRRSTTATSTLWNSAPWLQEALHATPTYSGVPVDAWNSLHSSSVFACTRLLSESIASLSLCLYKRDGDRTRKAQEHPLYPLLNFRPNRLQTSYEFRSLMMTWLCIHGNAYAEIIRDKSGNVTALWPMRPDRMAIKYDPEGGQLDYTFCQPNGPIFHLDPDSVLHIKALSTDGLIGYSPVLAGKNVVGLDLVQTQYASMYFGTGARIGGVIESPDVLGDEAIRNIRESFKKTYTSPAQFHEILLLEQGNKFTQFQMRNDEAQFLESRQFTAEEIARLFRVPVHMLGILDKSNYSITDALSREFVTQTLRPWLVNFEQSYMRKLLRPDEWDTYYVSHDLTDVLRGDPAARWDAYTKGIQMGVYSPNDVRRMEHLDPRPDGDLYLQPVNLSVAPFNASKQENKL